MGWFWILLICIAGLILLVPLMRWLPAGGRRRSPGVEVPEQPPPT